MSGDCCSKPENSQKDRENVVTETCCELHPPTKCGPTKCPKCGELGKTVQKITLGALLKPEKRPQIPKQEEFCFCRSSTCDVVYFVPGRVLFRKADLNVPVGLKEPQNPTAPICYCFGWNRKRIWDEIKQTGKSTAVESITKEVKAGNCFCERSNPQGTCCLGNVSQAIKEGYK